MQTSNAFVGTFLWKAIDLVTFGVLEKPARKKFNKNKHYDSDEPLQPSPSVPYNQQKTPEQKLQEKHEEKMKTKKKAEQQEIHRKEKEESEKKAKAEQERRRHEEEEKAKALPSP